MSRMEFVSHVWILRVEQVVPNSFQTHLNWHQALGMGLGALEIFFSPFLTPKLGEEVCYKAPLEQSLLLCPAPLPCSFAKKG